MRFFSTISILAAAALCPVLAGCARPAEPPAAKRETAAPAESRAITLRTVGPADLAATVAKYRGKVVLVDYWATWCDACKELFPHTVGLHREVGSQGLAAISVSFDDAEDEAEVLKFLTAQGAVFENLRAQTGASPRSATEFDIEKGALPFMQLYDRSGKLRKTFPAPIQLDQVEKAVKELVAEAASAT
jgi:thiol-disulfide isomerase/thioredoxin